MKTIVSILLGFSLLSIGVTVVATPAMAAAAEQDQLAEQAREAKPAMMHHRVAKPIIVPLDDDATAVLWKPDLTTVPLTISSGKIELPKTGVDNYHVIIAEQQLGNLKKAFIHYIYRHGKPSGHSTNDVTSAHKTELEIIPAPVPREHDRYYSKQSWSFIVHFQGKPLASHSVHLNTEHGSHLQQNTDLLGQVTFILPDDFRNVITGGRDKRSAAMTVKTEYQTDNKQWKTQLAANYSVNESHWRSTRWGIIVMIIGLIIGGLFIRLNKGKAGSRK